MRRKIKTPLRRSGREEQHDEHRVHAVAWQFTVEVWENLFGGVAEGRAAWEHWKHTLIRRGPHRPAPFWAYEPGIPEHLREELPYPDPRGVFSDPPVFDEDAARLCREQQIARYEWLIQSGRLEHDEIERAHARLAAYRRGA